MAAALPSDRGSPSSDLDQLKDELQFQEVCLESMQYKPSIGEDKQSWLVRKSQTEKTISNLKHRIAKAEGRVQGNTGHHNIDSWATLLM